MAEKDFIIEEKTTEETKEEVKEETPLEDVVLETEGGTKSLLGATSGTDIAATSLDTKTTPALTDNLILFNRNTNVGYQIDYDNLADAILNKITSKTYTNQVGGSSAATLLAQLSTLNSNITVPFTSVKSYTDANLIEATGYVSTGSNAPFSYAMIFTLKRSGPNDDRLQFASGLSTAHRNKFAWRACNNGVWGNWYQLVGTEIVPASST